MDHALPSAEEIAALPPDGGAHFNRLVFEKSPYLLQHAANPVDWYPWGEEALRRAREEDKLIFLSLGYASCHWCHVMARESFANEEVARLLGESYVAIKVDKEERPDLDEIYMHAAHLLNGGGGWPNNVWLTPAQEPWLAGSYFPPEDAQGRPGLKTHLRALAEMWQTRRAEVEKQAGEVTEALRRTFRPRSTGEAPVPPDRRLVDHALEELALLFDEKQGGFGEAPKFPPHTTLRLLLYEYARSADPRLGVMIQKTLEAMRRGGLRDHLGGGFHRYTLGAHWIVPHFEKMLYDNAQLLRTYTDASLLGEPHPLPPPAHADVGWAGEGEIAGEEEAEVARETAEWALREMRLKGGSADQGGGFASALDAESEGQEGKFYVWDQEEIMEVLGATEGELFCRVYNVRPQGNYLEESTGDRTGANVLYRGRDWAELARRERRGERALRERMAQARRRLLIEREKRVRPGRDDKVQAAGNGMMLGALAHAGRALGEPRYTEAAQAAAEFVLPNLTTRGAGVSPASGARLYHTWRDEVAYGMGFLDDYACLAEGLLELYEATGEGRWLEEARCLADTMLAHFTDAETGGLYFTADDAEPLLVRTMQPYDESTPASNAVAAWVLLRLAQETGEGRYGEALERLLQCWGAAMEQVPTGTQSLVLAVDMKLTS
jgi:uncharacterized protein YyaL (SSP411 family)